MENLQEFVTEIGNITTPTDVKANATIKRIRNEVKAYVEKNKLQSLVIGVSGGLDSACVAALCQKEYTGVPLIGVSIPMSSTNAHKEQAKWVGENYCDSFEEFTGWDNNELFSVIEGTDSIAEKAGFETKTFPKNVLQGNMKARLRMITLYDLARKTNGMVLSTDNLSEFQMGFWTICGDVGDFGPIQNIGKGFELPAIAKALGIREDIISQPPSDGLMVTEDNTDEAQLGASYKEVDAIMYVYLGDDSSLKFKMYDVLSKDPEGAQKVTNVIKRYESLGYKRNGTVNLTRDQIGL
jgi:NAD+ synthase